MTILSPIVPTYNIGDRVARHNDPATPVGIVRHITPDLIGWETIGCTSDPLDWHAPENLLNLDADVRPSRQKRDAWLEEIASEPALHGDEFLFHHFNEI